MVALTGGTGLLGTHILNRLLAEGIQVVALHREGNESNLPIGVEKRACDLQDQVSIMEACKGVDTLIHAAAFVSFNPARREKILEVNVQGTSHVVDACLQAGVKNLIHISSVAALGRVPGKPINEKSPWTGLYGSDYAESKYLAELEVFRGAEEGLTVSIVNPSVILCPSNAGRSSSVLFDYVWREKMFYVDGLLNYVDVRDVAEAAYRLYKKPQPGEKFILSAGSMPFAEFFGLAASLMKKRKPFIKVPPAIVFVAGWLEEMRCLIMNREPMVTRLTARSAVQNFQYENKKAIEELGLIFRPIDETLSWCCGEYARNVKVNKQ